VTTEDWEADANASPAQITLTDCLACSGCVTSAEAVLVSLQSHSEVLATLDSDKAVSVDELRASCVAASRCPERLSIQSNGTNYSRPATPFSGKVFVASVSPQVRASLAATYGTSERNAGWMIEQLLCGPQGIATGGQHGNRFTWVLDTNAMRAASLALEADALLPSATTTTTTKSPRLTSACPGWICYAEKTHPHVLPHLSPLKSPQALTGTLVKTVLAAKLGLEPQQIWHLAVMPCFDKKLEAARGELTDTHWHAASSSDQAHTPVRDVDCVITAREILMLADARGIRFPLLPCEPLSSTEQIPFPDALIHSFLSHPRFHSNGPSSTGTSGGFLAHVLAAQEAHYPNSTIHSVRGRNADVVEYTVRSPGGVHFRGARYYGFRNIQNLVRKLRPPKMSRLPGGKTGASRRPNGTSQLPNGASSKAEGYGYVEVMACPGGCTNGGGQIKVDDLSSLQAVQKGVGSQKEWLGIVDEAYFSMDERSEDDAMDIDTKQGEGVINGIPHSLAHELVDHWSELTGVPRDKLLYTTFNAVESDVGKGTGREMEHVVELASKIGGGW
jgi:iron only hydrogenase large subunit-like protein